MSKGFTGLNPGNQAFKQFKCPVLNVLMKCLILKNITNLLLKILCRLP